MIQTVLLRLTGKRMPVYPYQGLEGGHDAHRDGNYDLVEISDLLEYTKQPEGP